MVSGSNTSAAIAIPNGDKPVSGGWNRFVVLVENIEETVEMLRKNNLKMRNNILSGVGGKQIVIEDPSGNPIEVFEEKSNANSSEE